MMGSFPRSFFDSTLEESAKYKARRRQQIVEFVAQAETGKKDCQFSVNKDWATLDLEVLIELSRHPQVSSIFIKVKEDPNFHQHSRTQKLALGDVPIVMLEDAKLICTVHLFVVPLLQDTKDVPLFQSGEAYEALGC